MGKITILGCKRSASFILKKKYLLRTNGLHFAIGSILVFVAGGVSFATPNGADSDDPVIAKYCEMQSAEAALKSDALMRPALVSEYATKSVTDSAGDPSIPTRRFLRAGVELEIHSFVKALVLRDLAKARCDLFRQTRDFSAKQGASGLFAEERGLTAKSASLTESVVELRKELALAKSRLSARADTLRDVDEVSSKLTQLLLRQASVEGDLAQVKMRLPQIPSEKNLNTVDSTDSANIGLAEMKVERLQTDLAKRDFWEVTLGAGSERYWTNRESYKEEGDRKPYYLGVTVKYNLLGPLHLYRRSVYNKTLEEWGAVNPTGALHEGREASKANTAAIKTSSELVAIIDERRKEVDGLLTQTGDPGVGAVKSFRMKLLSELYELKAERAYHAAKIKYLMEVAESPKRQPPSVVDQPASIPSEISISEGAADSEEDGYFQVETPRFRAKSERSDGALVEVAFIYEGYSRESKPLASGTDRNQFGVYLRALNQCNLLYVMVRPSEVPTIVVQRKVNSDQETHSECSNNGYQTLKSDFTKEPDAIKAGQSYRLQSVIANGKLTVNLNGVRMWEGAIEDGALGKPGYAGIRSDNTRLRFKILR